MQIVFHMGAHSTDHDKLLKGLLKNKGFLASRGVSVPGPGRYRTLIRKTIGALKGDRASIDTQEALLDAITEEDSAERLVLSNENFICISKNVFEGPTFYPQVAEKIVSYTNLFHGHDLEFHIGICNPAVHIPTLDIRNEEMTYTEMMHGSDPKTLRWSSVIKSIQESNPDAQITVWCNEDTPLIWTQILSSLAGLEENYAFDGELDLVQEIMSADGMKRLVGYLKNHPPQNNIQKGRVIAAFLDKFARAEAIETEIDLPGWDETYVEQLTAIYEADVQTIKALPGVKFIGA